MIHPCPHAERHHLMSTCPCGYTATASSTPRTEPPIDPDRDCGHHSWGGLMALLDEHWPEAVFPTREDHPDRDPGPRIVSLVRAVDRLRKRVHELQTAIAVMQLDRGARQ